MQLPGDGPLGMKLLLWLVGPFMLAVMALLGASAYLTHEHMIQDRVAKLRVLVEVACALAADLEDQVVTGRMQRPDAIDRFRAIVYRLRYENGGYLFAYDFEGRVILLGNDPGVQGQNRIALRDTAGRPFIQDLIGEARRDGGGTVEYLYPRGPGLPPLPKLAYVRAFQPWNMFVGTGVYIDDIDAVFYAYLRTLGLVLIAVLAVAAALASWIGRYVSKAMAERRTAEARIVHLAHHDTLTDLPNRALLQDRLAQAVWRSSVDRLIGIGFLLCDLDRFKDVNDTFGHPTGDELLRQVSQRMRTSLRKVDTLARLGGDEFAIILLGCRHSREAEVIAARIVDAIGRPFEVYGHTVSVGVSIGIALAPADATDPVDLMKHADTALYVSKNRGRGVATVYSSEMSEGQQERHDSEADLRRAISANEFEPYYEPVIDLRSRRIVGFEALIYWLHPTRGVLGPRAFIHVAEACGLLGPVGERMLRMACLEAVGWPEGFRLGVNLSAQQIQAPGFVGVVCSALADTGLAADRLELEIVEHVLLSGGERVRSTLGDLRARGIRVSLDSFGTGCSSLTCIQSFPITKIKFDRSFIGGLGTSGEGDVILRTIVSLGGILGIATTVEGIETEEQAQRMLAANCGEGQGAHFGPPVPAGEVPEVIRRFGKDRAGLACASPVSSLRAADTAPYRPAFLAEANEAW